MVGQHTVNTILVLQIITSLYYTESLPQYKIKYHSKHPMSLKPPSFYRVRPWRMYRYGHHGKSYPDIKPSGQSWTPFYNENSIPQTNLNEENALRKLTIYNKPNKALYTAPKAKAPPKELFENFVTPKESGGYEVTTKKVEDSEPEPLGLPLGVDPDLAIALDDEEGGVGEEVRGLNSDRPEHRNPLVYVDSYGRLLGGNPRTAIGMRYHGKSAGRVRMQVFRGPTRLIGHGHNKKKWAQWGYYVVQPAATSPHHSYSHSSYPY